MDYNKLLNKNLKDSIIKKILKNPLKSKPSIEEAINISLKYNVPLHPYYLLYWNELTVTDFLNFLNIFKELRIIYGVNKENFRIEFPFDEIFKRNLEAVGLPHFLKEKNFEELPNEKWVRYIELNEINSKIILSNLNIYEFNDIDKERIIKVIDKLIEFTNKNFSKEIIEILSLFCDYEIRDKGGTYIGARMGRPEKAKMRKMDGSPYGLFPVGEEGGRLRNLIEAYQKKGRVVATCQIFFCENCNKETIYRVCDICGKRTEERYFEKLSSKEVDENNENAVPYKEISIDVERYLNNVRKILNQTELPTLVKGVRGMSNRTRIVEHLVKAFLREKNKVFVNKDGTVRYDMTEMGITHFKPKEIGTSIEKLKELGYYYDYEGNPLITDEQIIEIFPQDVILPDCPDSSEIKASEYIIRTGNFVDDLLENLYKLDRFYNFKSKEDTIGHLIIGLAPHTSAGIIGRIIGYSKTQGCFSHPMWHAAQRRNLDGDENGIILLLDALINFSREYLPDRRGAKTMDAPLVLTSHLYPDQIDDEVLGMDIVEYYPLEFYRKAKEGISPKKVKLLQLNSKLNCKGDERYLGVKFTHNTDNFNNTVLISSYKNIPSMSEKVDLQINLAKKIRAVDEDKVATLLIDKHFMKDIKGNLRKFSMQTFRCTNCNEKYRRPPLNGKCVKCGKSSINFTISEGFIKKYLEPSFKLVKNYNVDPYIKETLELVKLRIEGVFGVDNEKQKSLNDFFK